MGKITLAAVGDLWANKPFATSRGKLSKPLSILHNADAAFANLEGPLSNKGYPAEKTVFLRSDPSLVDNLVAIGLDVVNLANNHMLDYGHDALLDTLDTLDKAGIQRVGAGRNLQEAWEPSILEVEGVRLGFLGFSSTLPLGSAAGTSRPGVAAVRVSTAIILEPTSRLQEQPGAPPPVMTMPLPEDVKRLEMAINQTRERADMVIVAPHWGLGLPPNYQIISYQQELGHKMVEAGADLILGTHPHLIQPVEVYKGGFIFYSLSNFLFHRFPPESGAYLQWPSYDPKSVYDRMSKDSAIICVSVEDGKITELEFIPIHMDEEGNPEVADKKTAHSIIDRTAKLSEQCGTRFVRKKDGRVLIFGK